MRRIVMFCAALVIAGIGASCDAAFVFSNVSYTSNSLTFTINGDMSGYSAPTSGDPFFTGNDQFSIRYNGGDIWAGVGGFTLNSWSTSVFDNKSFDFVGNTGTFSGITPEYTWSKYTSNLSNAVATNRTVTVTFGANYLSTGAANPIVEFYWGNGSANFSGVNNSPTLLGTAVASSATPVPEPASLAFWGLGVAGALIARRKRSAQVA